MIIFFNYTIYEKHINYYSCIKKKNLFAVILSVRKVTYFYFSRSSMKRVSIKIKDNVTAQTDFRHRLIFLEIFQIF